MRQPSQLTRRELLYLAGVGLAACAAPSIGGAGAPAAKAVTLDTVIAGAKTEGTINATGPSSLGEAGFKKILDGVNKKHGLSLQGSYSSSGNLPDIVAKVVTESGTGGKTTWDVVILNDSFMSSLMVADTVATEPYAALFGLKPAQLSYDARAVSFANQLVLPVVNSKLVPPSEVPKSWEDILDPKWKGKIGVNNAIHHIVRLSQVWGDDKATDFAKRLAAQSPKLGLINETFQSLTLGQTVLSFTQTNSQVDPAIKKGAPVAYAADVRPAIAPNYHIGVLKGATNPNAATLMAGFMTDPVVADVWAAAMGKQSLRDPSTLLGQIYAKSAKDAITWDDKFDPKEFAAREKKYRQIIGFP
jgi:iron(III) transport system substrate-binding protein